MDKIEPEDIISLFCSRDVDGPVSGWFHCHPDVLEEVKALMGGDVIVEYIASDDGEKYFCSIRRKSS